MLNLFRAIVFTLHIIYNNIIQKPGTQQFIYKQYKVAAKQLWEIESKDALFIGETSGVPRTKTLKGNENSLLSFDTEAGEHILLMPKGGDMQ